MNKKNVLNNAIDFNFLSWINNAYIYVWQCSHNAFDKLIYDKYFENYKIHYKKATRKIIPFFPIWLISYIH